MWLNRKGCHREAKRHPRLSPQGTRATLEWQEGTGPRCRGQSCAYLSSRFCPTHTRPPCRGVGLLQDRWRTWKPIPQVVLQGDQEVQGVQPPFLERGSSGVTKSGSQDDPRVHPPPVTFSCPACRLRDCGLGRDREPEPQDRIGHAVSQDSGLWGDPAPGCLILELRADLGQ